MMLLSCQYSRDIALKVSEILHIDLSYVETSKYFDGESRVVIDSRVHEKIILFFSCVTDINNKLLELILILDALKRAGAKDIILVMPYLPYTRQDRISYQNAPISAAAIAKLLQNVGISKLITLDLHSSQIQGFFEIPVIEIKPFDLFYPIFGNLDPIVISPDFGGAKRALTYANAMNLDLEILQKIRVKNICKIIKKSISVVNKCCILVDDIVSGGGTILEAANILLDSGARSVSCVVTHYLGNQEVTDKLDQSAISKIYITNSCVNNIDSAKIEILDCSDLIANALKEVM